VFRNLYTLAVTPSADGTSCLSEKDISFTPEGAKEEKFSKGIKSDSSASGGASTSLTTLPSSESVSQYSQKYQDHSKVRPNNTTTTTTAGSQLSFPGSTTNEDVMTDEDELESRSGILLSTGPQSTTIMMDDYYEPKVYKVNR
jgi:hypothetical protein